MDSIISHLIHVADKRPPAVFWRQRANQYMAYIGCHQARKGKSKGKRVRTAHYLGRDLREATLNAVLIDRRWDMVVHRTKQRALWAKLKLHPLNPVWPTDEQQRIQEADLEELEEMGLAITLPPEEGEEGTPYLSIAQLQDKFLAAERARIGLHGRRGLKADTVEGKVKFLRRALKGIDTSLNVLSLTRDQVRQLVDYWLSPERKVTERTAGNYCKGFKRMIDWADNESICGFRKPKINDLFSFANTRGHIERYDADQMKRLLGAASERCRLYILLGLNTGYTQIDVANLLKDEILEIGGEMFLARRREKTSHQNDFKTLHHLWPETWELLRKHMAPDNAENLALLNVNGRKLKTWQD